VESANLANSCASFTRSTNALFIGIRAVEGLDSGALEQLAKISVNNREMK